MGITLCILWQVGLNTFLLNLTPFAIVTFFRASGLTSMPRYPQNVLIHMGRIPFTCSRTVYCVPEHCSRMLQRNISAQFYCSVLNRVFPEHCSFKLKYDSSFRHLESRGNSVSRCATPRII